MDDYLAFMRAQALCMGNEFRGGTTNQAMPLEEDEQALAVLAHHRFDVQRAKLAIASSLGAGRGVSRAHVAHA